MNSRQSFRKELKVSKIKRDNWEKIENGLLDLTDEEITESEA